jgi:hypothetical protein
MKTAIRIVYIVDSFLKLNTAAPVSTQMTSEIFVLKLSELNKKFTM